MDGRTDGRDGLMDRRMDGQSDGREGTVAG